MELVKLSPAQLSIINVILQVDGEGKAKQYPLSELTVASEIFKAIKQCVKEDKFVEGKLNFTSEQKVFITKQIDERNWTVVDAEVVFELKSILK